MTLHLGDCLEVMAELPENSVDTILTDPPYGLTFMGKDWDRGVPGVAFWEQALRVAKPGATLLAMGGTRTFHRLVCAIEDAGWIVRDSIAWLYGCLSEDTEILTINGWEHYHKDIELYPVLCYNIDKESFEFCKPERSFIYENKHTAYRIQSDYTDQIVSRNHRCIVERGGRKVFAYAETLEQQESVPILESLHNLPETIPNIYEGTSVTKQDLLERMRFQEYQQKQEGESNPSGTMRGEGVNNLPCMWERPLEVPKDVEEGGNTHLQQTVQRGFEGGGMEETRPQREGELDEGGGAKVSRAYDGGEQPSLEGRGDVLQKEGQLYGGEVCTMPRAVPTDGEERRLYYGTSADRGATLGENVEADRSSTSYRSRSDQQRSCESYAVSEQQCSQEVRSDGATRTTLATVNPIEYKGNVWCVQVPTGAFVARRNGHIFITGNSGFPKSYDISKGIDKQAGAERNQVPASGGLHKNRNLNDDGWSKIGSDLPLMDSNVPATPAAQLWHGWGTALKPAMELICVAMKPIDGTYVNNALTWGVAGLWIDGGRVGSETITQHGRSETYSQSMSGKNYAQESGTNEHQGRFPANVIHDGSDEVKELFPQTTSGNIKPYISKDDGMFGMMKNKEHYNSHNGDSGSAARFFYCAKASRSERNAGLEGMEESVTHSAYGDYAGTPEHATNIGKPRANHHPTVKPLALMRYLARLTKTPTGGVVLDPFMGSGTTGLAALQTGRKFIGIEIDPDYFAIAERRIKEAQAHVPLPFGGTQ